MEAKINFSSLLKPFSIVPEHLDYYEEALTHSSYAHERHPENPRDYQRLEFMGDAVFQIVSAELIYRKYPHMQEGEMTKLRIKLVREESFAKLGRELHLPDMLYLGKGEEKERGKKDAMIADCVEAFIGALFIDKGYQTAKMVALDWLNRIMKDLKEDDIKDYKSELQELIQSDSREPLKYEAIKTEGKDNAKVFYYRVLHDGVVLGEGIGKSKKMAEQEAAREALQKLAK